MTRLIPVRSAISEAFRPLELSSFKKISISSKTTVFLLLAIGIIFISLLFYTLETLLAFGAVYLASIPISIIVFNHLNKKNIKKISEEDHEDVL